MEFRKRELVAIAGMGDVECLEMNGKAFIEWQDAQEEGRSAVAIAATVIRHCCPAFEEKDPSELLDILTPGQLGDLFAAIINLSEVKEKNSEAEARPVSFAN